MSKRFLRGLSAGLPLVSGLLAMSCGKPTPRDFAADFETCAKLEGTPSRSDHAALTKCLVDRFGWPVEQADRATDSTVQAFYRAVDSTELVALEAQVAELRAMKAVQDSERVAAAQRAAARHAAQFPWVSSDSSGLFYRRGCAAARRLRPDDVGEWSDTANARQAAFQRSTDPGC